MKICDQCKEQQHLQYRLKACLGKGFTVLNLLWMGMAWNLQAQSLSTASRNSTPSTAAESAAAAERVRAESNGQGPSSGYVIMASDVLWLKVYQEADLETKAKVTREGSITLPLLGVVSVAGLTVEKAAEKIRSELDRRFLVNPQVDLSVSEYSKRKFTIMGQVGRPGIYEYSGEERMTLLQAIGLAGGLTRLAAPSKTTLQRLENGEYKNYKVDPDALGKSSTLTQFYLQHDDVITVGTRVF